MASKKRESEGLKLTLEMPSLGGSAISNCVAGSCIGYGGKKRIEKRREGDIDNSELCFYSLG